MTVPLPVSVGLSAPQAIASTTALVWQGSDPAAAAVILAHGAGTDMRHRHIQRHAAALVAAGHPTAVFNFAYTEMGRKRPDPAAQLLSAWRDVIIALRPVLGAERPLVIGGRSMGGRIASMVAAEDADAQPIAGVVCLAYPLHPPGRPDRLRVDHWPSLTTPILLVSGTRDSMAPLDSLRVNLEGHMAAGLATLHVLDGADHSFGVRKKDGRTEDAVFGESAAAVTAWLATIL